MTFTEAERLTVARQVDAMEREDGTSAKGLIDDDLILGACAVVDSTGVVERVKEWRALMPRGRGGRPQIYEDTDRLILVLMFVLLITGGSPQIAEMQHIVYNRLSANSRRALGLPLDHGKIARPGQMRLHGDRIVAAKGTIYYRLNRAFHRFVDVCDPFPGATHLRKTREEVEKIQADRDPAKVKMMRERMEWVMNAFLEATWNLLDEESRAAWQGNVTFDETVIFVWGQRGHKSGAKKDKEPTDSMSPEFEAGWHFMHGDPMAWGYALHITCTAPDPHNPGRHPLVAIAAGLDTPNMRNGQNATAMLTSIAKRGHPLGYAVSDRGYFNAASAENFNRPITRLGYKLVGDYNGTKKKGNLGITGTQKGAIFVEGAWYCPSMPQELIDATITFRTDQEWRDYAKRIRRRRQYMFRRKDGNAMSCPAIGPGATASCALKPDGPFHIGKITTHRTFAVVLDTPAEPPKCCTNHTSTTLTSATVEKLEQALQYGSREWLDVYKPLRSMIEGFNGYAKITKHAPVADKSHRRVRGFAANAIVAAMSLVATNIRKIRAFYDRGRPPAMAPRPRPKPNVAWEDAAGEDNPFERNTWDKPGERERAQPAAA